MEYGYKKLVECSFNEAVERVRKELDKRGFGVLTSINIKEKLKEKLGIDYDDYVILGACNPPFAYEALKKEKDVGLMLPCNVIVYEDDGSVFVSAIMPTVAMGMIDNSELGKIATRVEEKLKMVVDGV